MLKASVEAEQDEEEKLKVMAHFLDEIANEEFNLIEKYPLHYYEDEIESLEHALMFRLFVAMEYCQGNT